MTDDEYRTLQKRGQGARMILEDASFDEVEASLLKEWTQTAPWRSRRREQIYAEVRGLRQVKARLQQIASDAEYEFKQRQKRRP